MCTPHGRAYLSERTFLRLEDPEVLGPNDPSPPEEKSLEWLKYWLFRTSDLRYIPDPRLVGYVEDYKRCKRSDPIDWKSADQFLEILFPTRYWTERGIRYKQKVSRKQVTREELKDITERLDFELEDRQGQLNARYCPIRFALHMELFDELIRQAALSDPMRAYMLERIRGELCQTVDAYREVLDVSVCEQSKSVSENKSDPELMILQRKMEVAETQLANITEENETAKSDMRELELKYEVFNRIQNNVREPEIALLQKLGANLERQLWHFENPPEIDEGEQQPALSF